MLHAETSPIETSAKRGLSVAIVSVFAAACLFNILNYINHAAGPLIRSDAWFFLDALVMKWANEGFSFYDLFSKAGITDHAQPINKLFLYFNYRWLNLDFYYEGIAGFVALSLIVLFSILLFFKSEKARINSPSIWLFLCSILALTSLNVTEIYTWTLVTFGINYILLSGLLAYMVWQYLNNKKTLVLVLAVVVVLLIGDTRSLIAWSALSLTVIIMAMKGQSSDRKRVLRLLIFGSIVIATYFFAVNTSHVPLAPDDLSAIEGRDIFTENPLLSFVTYSEAIRIVFSSSVLHQSNYLALDDKGSLSWILAAAVLFFYLRFFLITLVGKREIGVEKFLVLFFVLYATVAIAALFIGRVPKYGVDYLLQPRYVLIYQIIPFALLFDLAISEAGAVRQKLGRTLIYAFAFSYLILQLFFAVRAYAAVPWISRFYDGQAKVIGFYTDNPSAASGNCRQTSVMLCSMHPEHRNARLEFLKSNNLNLFNTNFQWKYRLFPQSYIGYADSLKILNWGPRGTTKYAVPNIQPDGSAGLWIQLSSDPGLGDVIVYFNGLPLATNFSDRIITALIPAELFDDAGAKTVHVRQVLTGRDFSVGEFHVMEGHP